MFTITERMAQLPFWSEWPTWAHCQDHAERLVRAEREGPADVAERLSVIWTFKRDSLGRLAQANADQILADARA